MKKYLPSFLWKSKTVDDDFEVFMFVSDDDEHDWIVKTCRKGWDEHVGYRPDLFN